MRLFFKNSFLMSILLLIVMIVIEFMLLFIPNTYSYKRKFVETHINEIRYLFLGNSYIGDGVVPSIIGDSVFNMAISGRDLVYDVELAKRYIPQMSKLEVVIMPLCYQNFYWGRETQRIIIDWEKTYKCMYYKYMGIHVDGFLYWSEFLNSKMDFMPRFLVKNKNGFKNDITIDCDSLGYSGHDLANRKDGWEYKGLPVVIDTTKAINKDEYVKMHKQFKMIAEAAYNYQVKFILLGTPIYRTYQEIISPYVNREISEFVNELKLEYPNVEYYDYRYDKRFGSNDFIDAGHLTEIGAIKFSRIIKDEVLGSR